MATAGDILTRLNEKLNDLAAVRWPNAEHFRAMTDAQNAILIARPDLFEHLAVLDPVAGVEQDVPADCYLLLDVAFNLDGNSNPASPIFRIDRSRLDRQRPGWPAMGAAAKTDHWMQDDRERTKFYVCPPQPSSDRGKYQIRYAKRPTAITAVGNELAVTDEGVNAVYNFCMHRALEKDEKFAGSPTAAAYMEKFSTFIGVQSEGQNQADAARSARERT